MSVGYVAFMEIGDKPGWENHYVRVSSSFGAFLHDSGILGILPDDYYQALSLGFRSQDCGVCGVESTECLQMVKQRAAERQLATGEYYRVFHNLQSLRLSDEPVANILPHGSKDIWMFSSAGFGVLCRQVSCKVDESDFLRFAERCTNPCVRAVRECSIGYHSHTMCRRFLDEREHENFSCAGVCADRIEGRRFLALDIPVCKGRLMCGYCYDRLTRTLGCWFGR